MTNADLVRKIAEHLGWRWESRHMLGYWHPPTCTPELCDFQHHVVDAYMPDFLSPAVFWSEFEKWRMANHLDYMHCTHDNIRIFEIFRHHEDASTEPKHGEAASEVSAEDAGCRAWLAALEAGGSK